MDFSSLRPRIRGAGGSALRVSNAYGHLQGEISFDDAEITDTQLSAIYLQDKIKAGPRVDFRNAFIQNANLSASTQLENEAPLVFHKLEPSVYFKQDAVDGNVGLTGITVCNNPGTRPLVWIRGRPQYFVDGISGSIDLLSGNATISSTYASNIAITVL